MKKYIVKCPYCGQNYIVEAREGQDLQCDACGAQNGLVDVVRTLEYYEENKTNGVPVPKNDPDLETINSYHDEYIQWDEESEHSASDGMVSLMKALLGEISINSWALVITIVVIMIVFIMLNI